MRNKRSLSSFVIGAAQPNSKGVNKMKTATPMHERIRDYYPAETRIGKVINSLGCFPMFVIEKHIASNDWKWAHEQAVKQYRAKRLQAAKR